MGNMSYCACQNTSRDLDQVIDILENKSFEELSEDEQKAFKRILHSSYNLLENHAYLINLSCEFEERDNF